MRATQAESAQRREIEAAQLARLHALLDAIVPANAFYGPRLRSVGDIGRLAEFSQKVPYTSKQDLIEDQRKHPPYGSNLTYPVERYTRFCQTSATTGKPMRWLD